ncbi:metal-dependent hydrolase [Mucilaginibacter dorajii]|uniref:Metal-dependent hydrolase n=1 Tax=Mucilaginibacter dorajii TaxID=692994 RepID=A0ABP7PTP1_9SPHI|nr:metal-dependent hydrolase [Mucilaginibacter dorajii]MCS3735098.1 inner membrane protein [Mucilaginibacter dorajii]
MDTVTHLALGACTGEVLLGKKLGKSALAWGAVSQCLPDIDTALQPFFPADKAFLIHRGLTHSFLFTAITGFLLALIAQHIHKRQNLALISLIAFFCFELCLHDLLDCCNSYGTGLLEPFSNHRFSVNLLYVVDPLFTLALLAAAVILVFKHSHYAKRAACAYAGLYISALYLCFAVYCKTSVNSKILSSLNSPTSKYFTTPAPFNSMLWYVVVHKTQGDLTTYSSVWDDSQSPISFEWHPQADSLLKTKSSEHLRRLIEFADNDYIITNQNGQSFFNIPRFEQVQGWAKRDAPFSFSYPLNSDKTSAALLQKGRLSGWNGQSIKTYLRRIAGHQIINTQTL